VAGRLAAGQGFAITYKMYVQQPTKNFCNFMQKGLAKNMPRPKTEKQKNNVKSTDDILFFIVFS